jgi:hypothetical protein
VTRTEQIAHTLRAIADRLKLETLRQIALQPGVRAVYRLTVYHHDRRALDSVATVRRLPGEAVLLTPVHEGMFFTKAPTYTLPVRRYEAFTAALQTLRFDHLSDQPGLPLHGLDFWMLERAAVSFVHGVIVAPETASGVHRTLVSAIQAHLPEALREIART